MANTKYVSTRGLYHLLGSAWTGATIQMGLLIGGGITSQSQVADLDTVAELLGVATEASVGGYSRQTLANKTATQDDTNDRVSLDADDVVFANLATGQTISGIFTFFSGANDGARDLISVEVLNPPILTNGQNLTVAVADFLRTSAIATTGGGTTTPPVDPTPGVEPPPPPPPDDGSWPRPASRSAVGPQPGVSPTPDPRTVVTAGTYNGLNFFNGLSLSGVGAFKFVNCNVPFFNPPTGIVSGRTVLLQHCQTFGFFNDGGMAGWTMEWVLAKGNHLAIRPEGSPQNNITVSTPFLARSSLFVSEGRPDADTVHCEAVQCLGGKDMTWIGCWFEIEPRLNSAGQTMNTAAYTGLTANSTFIRCGFGADHAAFSMIYSGGPNNNFNDCVVGVCGQPGMERALQAGDFNPDTIPRAILNGQQL